MWGAPSSTTTDSLPWLSRLRTNDPGMTALHIMPFRKLSPTDVCTLFRTLLEHRNTHLMELNVSGKPLDVEACELLADFVVMRWNMGAPLRSLCVGDAKFGRQESGGGSLLDVFVDRLVHGVLCASSSDAPTGSVLQDWDLSGKSVSIASLQKLSLLPANVRLPRLNLSHNADLFSSAPLLIVEQGVRAVLERCSVLDLSGCVLTADIAACLRPLLAASALEELIWHDLLVASPAIALELGRAVSVLKRIYVTVISASAAEEPSFGDHFLHGMFSPPTECSLTTIYLNQAGITEQGLQLLFCHLSQDNCTVESLFLQQNRISGEAFLSSALFTASSPPSCRSLKKLVLDGNPIGDACAHALLRCSQSPLTSLEELSLLACGLEACFDVDRFPLGTLDEPPLPSLETLELSCNHFGQGGWMPEYLCMLPKLKRLGLGGQKPRQEEDSATWMEELANRFPNVDITFKISNQHS